MHLSLSSVAKPKREHQSPRKTPVSRSRQCMISLFYSIRQDRYCIGKNTQFPYPWKTPEHSPADEYSQAPTAGCNKAMDWLLFINMSIEWCFYIHCLSFKNNLLISFLKKNNLLIPHINSLCHKPELLKDGYKAMLFHQVNIKWKDTALLHQGPQSAPRYVHLLPENPWRSKHLLPWELATWTGENTQTNSWTRMQVMCLPSRTCTSGSLSTASLFSPFHKIFMQRTASFACHNNKLNKISQPYRLDKY